MIPRPPELPVRHRLRKASWTELREQARPRAQLAHDVQRAACPPTIVVAEGAAALGEKIMLLPDIADLFHFWRMSHGDKLAFLDFHRLGRFLAASNQNIGLAAKKSRVSAQCPRLRRLQHCCSS